MDLQAIRDFVRTHMDLDTEDLPDTMLDTFCREASRKVERAEKRWPMYEAAWTLATEAGISTFDISALDPEVREISSVTTPTQRLRWLGPDEASTGFLNDATRNEPRAWSLWGSTLTVFPIPDKVHTLTILGYRQPKDWVADGAGAEPDMHSDLHLTVATWVLSRAYAQQEDMELAAYFAQAFDNELETFRRRFVDTPAPQPLILGRGRAATAPFGRLRYDWEQ